MIISTKLQQILVKRWAEASWTRRYLNNAYIVTLQNLKAYVVDNLQFANPMLRALSKKGTIR